ncbi:hypothetical protein KEF85_02595 [Methylomonas paludis]|uniref:Carbohydrate kinase PfkB domain-containing protein n=1 Tax=Methylomonas paludis TaxID=1173101 RepID=A0A975MQ28_9GAMM|nr:PfkB family carbohydrate kinase [Methylomonas paludis]QWF71394.1 hypothetical protein KEF85_02595 [Methylomonas paludis]
MNILVLGSYVQAVCLDVAYLPGPGESLLATALHSDHGGKGFNVAIGLHRLDMPVLGVFAVGADAAGQGLRQVLKQEGVSDQYVVSVGSSSGFGVGFIAGHGENFLAVYPGANAELSPAHLTAALAQLDAHSYVYAQFEIGDAPILAAFEYARKLGAGTVLNPSPWRQPSAELLGLTDVLIVNQTEAIRLLNRSDSRHNPDWPVWWAEWRQQTGWQGKLLVTTLGAQGSIAIPRDEQAVYCPARPINMLDATGAGDAFSAGLLAGLAAGKSWSATLQLANACGAWVASSPGVFKILPSVAQVAEFMKI